MKSLTNIRLLFSTFNKPTILQSLRSYKNSPAQQHLHSYVRSEAELQKIKKQKIDYDFITKESAGVMMFREFAFQEKTEEILVPHMNCELAPSGAWTFEQIKKELGGFDNLTRTESQNIEMMEECQGDIENSIKQFYENVGKKNYQFNLQEEINKINQMTEEQFRQYAKILHNRQFASIEEPKTKDRQSSKSSRGYQ